MRKVNWIITLGILLIATIVDLFVPDPLPFVDEILLISLSIFSFIKAVK